MRANRVQSTVDMKRVTLFAFYISHKDLLDTHTSDMTRTHKQCIKNYSVLSLRNEIEAEPNFVRFEKIIFFHNLSSFFSDCMLNGALVLCSNFFPFLWYDWYYFLIYSGAYHCKCKHIMILCQNSIYIKDHCFPVLLKPKWYRILNKICC